MKLFPIASRYNFSESESKCSTEQLIEKLKKKVETRNSSENEFLQAFHEIFQSLKPLFEKDPRYLNILEQIVEPERVIMFRVPWIDDQGRQQVNRGFRIQYSSALGPYKGGLRFHPTVNLSVMKFLGLEQIFKNALTDLAIGGAKGGSDFDPRNKSENEIMRFCQSFMTELSRYIGIVRDVPAGDINVGTREIGYLFGQYKRLNYLTDGALTGKSVSWGGSYIRPEATGYGTVYFLRCWAKQNNIPLKGARCIVSGAGNVALYAVQKLIDLEAVPVSVSDSTGYLYDEDGITKEKLEYIFKIKEPPRKSIEEYCTKYPSAKFHKGKRPWEIPDCVFALACATQNEVEKMDAVNLVKSNCKAVIEGANMPCSPEAVQVFKDSNIGFCPGKAANAGGVAVSALEMSQNSSRVVWTPEEVDKKLEQIMTSIYETCSKSASEWNRNGDLEFGANIAGFLKVAVAVQDQGCT